jgi:hypothetical protein
MFLDARRDAGKAQFVEKTEKHGSWLNVNVNRCKPCVRRSLG